MNKVAATFVSAFAMLCFIGGSLVVTSSPVFAAKADKKEEKKEPLLVSKKVGVALNAANQEVAKKQWDAAIQKVDEADAVSPKTPFEQYKIDEFRAYVYIQQGTKMPEVLALYEKSLATPEFMEPEVAENRLKQLTVLAAQTQNFPKTIEYGKKWLATHPDDTTIIDLIARSSYISKDYKGALEALQSVIAISESAGKVPQEIWLQLVPSCASNLGDQDLVLAANEKLVRYYPKPEYWSKLLVYALKTAKSDLSALYVLRLMADTGTLSDEQTYYMDYAQLAMGKALPAEALTVLNAGFDKKVLGVSATFKEQQQRKLAEAKQKSQVDRAQLPDFDKEAQASKGGQLSAGVGLEYYSFGMYDDAIRSIKSGISKGSLKTPEDAHMILGISYLRTGQKDLARAEFQSIPADSPLAQAAKLWAIRSYN